MKKRQNKDGTGHINIPLYKVRKTHKYTQAEFGRLLGGYHRETVAKIESGETAGKYDFWRNFQELFNIPDADMWLYINGVEQPEKRVI